MEIGWNRNEHARKEEEKKSRVDRGKKEQITSQSFKPQFNKVQSNPNSVQVRKEKSVQNN